MVQTLFYQAGVEANQTQLSYGVETNWGSRPVVAFKAIRYTSDTLALTKTRQRPNEINITREVSQAVTTEQSAAGTINYALSWGTYDDFFSSLCQADWSAPVQIFSILADITMTSNGSNTLTISSTLAGKFAALAVGQRIRVSGFTGHAAYNSWWHITAMPDTSHLTLFGFTTAAGTESSVTSNQVQIAASTITNGTTFKSLFVQQKFTSSKFKRYGGCYVTRMTLTGSAGAFFTGAIDVIAQSEVAATADASTGATIAAPQGTVIDPVAGFVRMTFGDNPNTIAGNLDQISITLENTGAAGEFTLGASSAAVGAAAASGILGGTFTGSGAFRMFCKDFQLYQNFQAETAMDLEFTLQDAMKQSYVFAFQNVVVMCKVNATGPGTAVMVDVTFECNPDPVNGGTFQLDRFPAPN